MNDKAKGFKIQSFEYAKQRLSCVFICLFESELLNLQASRMFIMVILDLASAMLVSQ